MNIRPLESLTKEELIELIKHGRQNHMEDALAMVPVEPVKIPSEHDIGDVFGDVKIKSQYSHHQWGLWKEFAHALLTRYGRPAIPAIPEGFKLVPIEPTPEMLIATYLPGGIGGYRAMLAAAPQPDHIPDAGKMVEQDGFLDGGYLPAGETINDVLNVQIMPGLNTPDQFEQDRKIPTDTEMLDWMIRKNAAVEHYPFHPIDDKFLVVNPSDDTLTSASNPREAISKAMRGEE